MPRRARKSRKSASVGALNVTGPGQFGQLSKLLGKNPVVLVFVYADWCGHCQHFKPDWKKLEATPNRNMAMVSVRDDAFKNSPLNNLVTPEGYPTVAVVSAANDVAVNLPTRDPEVLENIVTNANSLVPTVGSAEALNNNLTNIIQNNKSEPQLNNNKKFLVNPGEDETNIAVKKTHSQIVPVTRDTIEPPMSESEYLKNASASAPINMKQLGGGLWSALTGSGASASASASALNVTVAQVGAGRRRRRTHRRHRR
jgi:thiol-disulfide isomerase/thioredoxin